MKDKKIYRITPKRNRLLSYVERINKREQYAKKYCNKQNASRTKGNTLNFYFAKQHTKRNYYEYDKKRRK